MTKPGSKAHATALNTPSDATTTSAPLSSTSSWIELIVHIVDKYAYFQMLLPHELFAFTAASDYSSEAGT